MREPLRHVESLDGYTLQTTEVEARQRAKQLAYTTQGQAFIAKSSV